MKIAGAANVELRGDIEAHFVLGATRIDLRLAACLLRRSLVGAQTAYLIENAFGVELALQALESAIDWLAFTDNNFWHVRLIPSFLFVVRMSFKKIVEKLGGGAG